LNAIGGTNWGTLNEKQVELADLIIHMVPSVDMVRFCCSGTEASMYAARLARGYTKKRMIIKAIGGWHGFNDVLNWYRLKPYKEKTESMGQLSDFCTYVEGIPLGDLEETIETIRRNRNDLAGVILEVRMTKILENKLEHLVEYLKAVKEELERHDALLILDEVITGFRLGPGGAQEYFGVNADLTTFGKVLGGGMPIGAVGGREEVMDLINPLDWQSEKKNKSEMVWIGGGTFSGNIMTMTAGLETLKILNRKRSIYDKISQTGREIRTGIGQIFEDNGLPFKVLGFQSAFNPDIDSLSSESKVEWKIRLFNNGVYGHRPEGYTSGVHDYEDVQKNITAVNLIVADMKKDLKRSI
jgi:glutamate-1-semialdehyde 2,1-aminomutase